MKHFPLHLVSDATGETLNSVANAALVQFEDARADMRLYSMVRSRSQMERVVDAIEQAPGMVMFTLLDNQLREMLQSACRRLQIPCVAVLDPVFAALGTYLGSKIQAEPGRQHIMDAHYFERIEALHFAMAHDDAQHTADLEQADIVLVGVSRTSKTPTCIYLANRGFKTANVPLIPNVPLPPELEKLTRPLVVGLTTSPDRLVQIRRNRLLSLNQKDDTDYVDIEAVKQEVAYARRLFTKRGWPVIDVTRRSIEETAAAILSLHARRGQEKPAMAD
ncbi:MAG: kinase/pyrophosphorylase [Alphaproteobacteria bacterium]|nr:kinase/pyrophosphorylase [Alphaproteobacteria bacterium]